MADGITKLPWQLWTHWRFCWCFQNWNGGKKKFPEISGEEIQKLAKKAVNKNTVKIIVARKQGPQQRHDITKELDECLSRFFAEICKSDGSDYEPDSLRVMLAAIDNHRSYVSHRHFRLTPLATFVLKLRSAWWSKYFAKEIFTFNFMMVKLGFYNTIWKVEQPF